MADNSVKRMISIAFIHVRQCKRFIRHERYDPEYLYTYRRNIFLECIENGEIKWAIIDRFSVTKVSQANLY